MVYESSIKIKKDDLESESMKTNFKATLSKSQQNKLSMESSHSGVWQRFQEKTGN
jgi:hypothetical protein